MDIFHTPSPLHGIQFHHVLTNPPFYNESHLSQNQQINTAYHQKESLSNWISFCLRHVRAKGSLCIIHRTEALPELLSILNGRLGGIEVFPIASHQGEPAKSVIIRGIMNSKKPLTLHPPIIMHDKNGGRSESAEQLLRQGIALDSLKK